MKSFDMFVERPMFTKKADPGLIVSIILFLGLGYVTLFVSSQRVGLNLRGDEMYFIRRQILFGCAGLVFLLACACIDIKIIRTFTAPVFFACLGVCALTLIPGIGTDVNGARRWINIPHVGTFQPSEFAKLAVIVFLANLFDKKADRLDDPMVSTYPAIVGLGVFVFVVILQKDFTTALTILLLGLALFFIAGVYLRWFALLIVLGIPILFLFIFTEEYRVERVLAWLLPNYDMEGMSYQATAASRAIRSGGIWGNGMGTGLQYTKYVPEVQSDYIFAGWTEAMGFVGVLIYFLLLGYFCWRCFAAALHNEDRFRALIAFGCCFLIVGQSVMNCGVVCGAFPSTGIPLPFFSSGGSSLIVTMGACGLLINVSRYENVLELEDE
ncbi:MAG: cell division protein FtsW [Treponema sp.]|nr:cell division protein FtsW [Candidatus Treponema caballi]